MDHRRSSEVGHFAVGPRQVDRFDSRHAQPLTRDGQKARLGMFGPRLLLLHDMGRVEAQTVETCLGDSVDIAVRHIPQRGRESGTEVVSTRSCVQ